MGRTISNIIGLRKAGGRIKVVRSQPVRGVIMIIIDPTAAL